jgi:WD40 repeat protein
LTGGGSEDRTIKIWNTSKDELVNSIDTRSQVCSLMWTKNKEIISTHGNEMNGINIWDYKTSKLLASIKSAHEKRVLYSCQNNEGTRLLTCSSDELLKIWKIKKIQKNKRFENKINSSIR